jgi:hypothetical protein
MPKSEYADGRKNSQGNLNRFESGGELGPIEDRTEYEKRLNELSPNEKEIANKSARLADLCQYFSAQKMDIPPELLDQVSGLRRLATPGRIRALKEVNRALMEYLHDVGQDPGIRQ